MTDFEQINIMNWKKGKRKAAYGIILRVRADKVKQVKKMMDEGSLCISFVSEDWIND